MHTPSVMALLRFAKHRPPTEPPPCLEGGGHLSVAPSELFGVLLQPSAALLLLPCDCHAHASGSPASGSRHRPGADVLQPCHACVFKDTKSRQASFSHRPIATLFHKTGARAARAHQTGTEHRTVTERVTKKKVKKNLHTYCIVPALYYLCTAPERMTGH